MAISRSFATCVALLVGCTTVEVVPSDGGAGGATAPPGPSTGGSGGNDAGGSGVGAAGGSEPGLVPGCEVLELAGEPLVVGPEFPRRTWLLARENEGATLMVEERIALSGETAFVSYSMADPFGAWPPRLGARVEHLQEDVYNARGVLFGRADGTFALAPGARAVFQAGSPGVARAFEDGWTQVLPHPTAAGPFDVVHTDTTLVTNLMQLTDLAATPTLLGTLNGPECATVRAASGPGGRVYSRAPDWYCADQTPAVSFQRVVEGRLENLGGFPLPFNPWLQWLEPRTDGYWYAMWRFDTAADDGSPVHSGLVVYALDRNGQRVGDPFIDDSVFGDTPWMFRPWRDDFVVSHRSEAGISVYVTDGHNRTSTVELPVDLIESRAELAIITGGPDERSILFAYPTWPGVALYRADCVTPAE